MLQKTKNEPIAIEYNGKVVNARVVTITSTFNHNIDKFFEQEMIKTNTQHIVKPFATISFHTENKDAPTWEEGFTYQLIVKIGGILNIWGLHTIHIVKIDKENTTIITEEHNSICKVWNHSLTFKKIDETHTEYTDQVVLYAGWLTKYMSKNLIFSYLMRHKSWNKLLNKLA